MTLPITIDRALIDPNLLGAALGDHATWATWLVVLKAAFGLPLSDAQRDTFISVAGSRAPPTQRVRELWAVVGRRGGKSRMAAALAVYLATFVQHKLAHGERGLVLVLAASQAQARVVFEYALAFLQSSPVLRQEIADITRGEIRLRSGVVIAIHSNSFRTIRGRTLLAAIFDEISFWRDETSAMPDVETYRAVLPALATTNGMLIAISTPYRKIGLLHQKHRDYFGTDSAEVLVVQGGTQAFNPKISTNVIAAQRHTDPVSASSEWDAEFRVDLQQFLADTDIEAAVNYSRPLELPPRSDTRYQAFCDASGGRHDHYCVAIAHNEDASLVVDVIRGRAPPFDPDSVTSELADLVKSYGVSDIVGDNYSAAWTEQAWNKTGVTYRRSAINKSAIYLEALTAFTRNIASLPNHARLLKELRLLERRVHRSGKDTVDHGAHGSDDYANAVCGVLYLLGRTGSNYPDALCDDWSEDQPATPQRRHPNLDPALVRKMMQPVALIPRDVP